jgi:hypothetical protein
MVSEERRPISHYIKKVPDEYVRKLCILHVTNVNSQNIIPFITNTDYLFNVIVKLLSVSSCTNNLAGATSLSKRLRNSGDSSSGTEQILGVRSINQTTLESVSGQSAPDIRKLVVPAGKRTTILR